MPEDIKVIKEIKIDPSNMPVTDPDDVKSVYANNMTFALSPWDIRLAFTEMILEPSGAYQEKRANIVMTPAHAKAVLAALVNGIKQYEDNFGVIAPPKQNAAKVVDNKPKQ